MLSFTVVLDVVSVRDVVEVPGEEGVDQGIDDDTADALGGSDLLVENGEEGKDVAHGGNEEADSHPFSYITGGLLVVLLQPLVPLEGGPEGQGEDDTHGNTNVPEWAEQYHGGEQGEKDDLKHGQVGQDFHSSLDWNAQTALLVVLKVFIGFFSGHLSKKYLHKM